MPQRLWVKEKNDMKVRAIALHRTQHTPVQVKVSSNHYFAGKDVTLKLKVTHCRPATEAEVRHRHVHGYGGVYDCDMDS
jgi:FKBP-type peptidyl-prolyl cis-trans isomerase 2